MNSSGAHVSHGHKDCRISGVSGIFGGIRSDRLPASRLKRIAQKVVFKYLVYKIVANNHRAKLLSEYYDVPAEKIIVIHNCIDFSHAQRLKSAQSLPVRILSIGRFIPEKDYLTAIKSISFLVNEYPELRNNIKYDIVGYGELHDVLSDMIRKRNLEDIINLQSDEKGIDAFLELSDIFLSTSINEGMPNAVMEAMSHHLPIVATDAGDTGYLVRQNLNGYIVAPGDYKAIAHRLRDVITNRKVRLEFGEMSNKIIKQEFSPVKFSEKYFQLIENLT